MSGLLSSTPDELGGHVARLASDRELAASLARRARQHVDAHFDTAASSAATRRCTGSSSMDVPAMGNRNRRADGLRVAVLTRAVTPLHGVGGLERSTYDLVQHLLERGARVDLFTRPPRRASLWAHDEADLPLRALPHVPGRRTAGHDDPRSVDGLSRFRAPARARGGRARPLPGNSTWYGLGASTPRLCRRPPARGGGPRRRSC
ncbi:MAG: hypothetical protein MZV64_13565 [Ignavibacteriales bacterium]|nr:hypothetical protein [Ignavibacteriales bacterium]